MKLSAADSLIVAFCVGISNFVLLPIMGALSDRIWRWPLLAACTLLALFTAYPVLAWLVATPTFQNMLIAELWLSFLYAGYNGATVVALTEVMPADVRASGFSLAHNLATALFGGLTPLISTYLIKVNAAPGWWMTFAAACGLLATFLFLPRYCLFLHIIFLINTADEYRK